ncbi:class I SAM-dependent methyltransferase [Albibacillus kandeliae]|uniref:class I SAM-dependent methyltransferase n=1 Tax=Albibacillus kandeliae TaxID=2174228 RepID=UPI000D69452B|nr:methyltransferase domain-containing protein [Albibacillus kandeliae]
MAHSATATTFAERYESTLVPVIFRPWAKELIRRANPRDGEAILDLACGTGAVTMELAAAGVRPASLTCIDISPDMLAVAETRAREAGVSATFHEAAADSLPLHNASVELAFCQQALQFFPDKVKALHELHRVMVPGGRVAFCVSTALSDNPLLDAQARTLEKHAGAEAGNAVRAICSLTDPGMIRELFEEAGFSHVEVERVSLALTHPDARTFAAGAMGGMHTGDKLSPLSDAERGVCIAEFLSALGECFDGTALHFPHVSNVITARA